MLTWCSWVRWTAGSPSAGWTAAQGAARERVPRAVRRARGDASWRRRTASSSPPARRRTASARYDTTTHRSHYRHLLITNLNHLILCLHADYSRFLYCIDRFFSKLKITHNGNENEDNLVLKIR